MSKFARPSDPFWIKALRQWNVVWRLLLGAMFLTIAARVPLGSDEYGAMAVLAAIALCHLLVDRFPDNPVVRPQVYLAVLILGIAWLSVVWNGSGALLFVALPHFWIYGGSAAAAIALSCLGGAAGMLGALVRQGWGAEFGGTLTSVLISVTASALVGLWVRTVVAQSHERARLIGELERTQTQLAAAHQHQGAAEERERMARDIHDTLAQGFASIVVLAEAARGNLGTDPAKSEQQLHSIEKTARDNLTEARELVSSGRPAMTAGSFAQTLRRTLDRFAEDTGLEVEADLGEVDCDQPARIALLRCTQESLANVRKHAVASSVFVGLSQTGLGVELEITDDGTGFVLGSSRGFGLDGMRDRLAELGGELTITSSVGDGTRVLALVPAHSEVRA